MLGKTRRVHFIGIGGIGMSGIAELLVNLGYVVSGSDEKRSAVTERLTTLGIRVAYGHQPANVGDAEVVVMSSAVRDANAEVREALRRQIPVIPRAEMLAELMRLRYAIAVAGSHGKTTTTSMIAFVLEQAGLDPTAVIGGRVSAFGSNARLGQGQYMVAEADESDRSFLKLFPTIAVMTNIDHEHLENYGGFNDLQQAFVDFANKVPFYGAVIACADDPPLSAVLPRLTRRVTTYGLSASADFMASDIQLKPMSITANVNRRVRRGEDPGSLVRLGSLALQVPGRHNLENALAAVAVATELGLSFDQAAAGLRDFRGAERRFEVRGEPNGILVVDDYGHHPTEIAAVLDAAHSIGRRIVVAFQPHRFTRTAALMDAFGPALAGADHIVLTDIYAAGEDRIPGVTVDVLADAVRRSVTAPVEVVASLDQVVPAIVRIARSGDLVITLGAGSIGTLPDQLIAALGGESMSAVAAPADRRFRRSHVKPSRTRRRWAGRLKPLLQYVLAAVVTAYGLYLGSSSMAHAHVLRVDRILVGGNERLSQGEVLAVLSGLRGESLVWTDLDRWRQRLLASPWVRDASLRRSLPSTVEVVVSEREPIAIGRINDDMYLIDERGTIIDQYGPQYQDLDLPIVDGLTAAPPLKTQAPSDGPGSASGPVPDRARADLAARVIAALRTKPAIGGRLSQIDVSDFHNAQVILAGDAAVISLGEDQFLARLESYLDLAPALHDRVTEIDHVDVRFDNRVYVRPKKR